MQTRPWGWRGCVADWSHYARLLKLTPVSASDAMLNEYGVPIWLTQQARAMALKAVELVEGDDRVLQLYPPVRPHHCVCTHGGGVVNVFSPSHRYNKAEIHHPSHTPSRHAPLQAVIRALETAGLVTPDGPAAADYICRALDVPSKHLERVSEWVTERVSAFLPIFARSTAHTCVRERSEPHDRGLHGQLNKGTHASPGQATMAAKAAQRFYRSGR
jgi:hypothetical protein